MTMHEQRDRVGPSWNVAINGVPFAERLVGSRFRTSQALPGTSRSLFGSSRSLATTAGTFLFLLGLVFWETRSFEVVLRRLNSGLFGTFRCLAMTTAASPTTAGTIVVGRRFVFLFVATGGTRR
jgi:hypothetical protein